MPAKNGPCLCVYSGVDFFNAFLICNPAKQKRLRAPSMDTYSLNCGNAESEIAPTPSSTTRGNSTIVWPYAILKPVFHPPLMPYAIFAAKSGPGDMTPDTEIVITIAANSSKDVISEINFPNTRKS